MTYLNELFVPFTEDKSKELAQTLLNQDTTNPMRRAFGLANAFTSNAVTWGAADLLMMLSPNVLSHETAIFSSVCVIVAFIGGASIRNDKPSEKPRSINYDFAMAAAKWKKTPKFPVARATLDGALNGFKKNGVACCVGVAAVVSALVVAGVGGCVDYVAGWAKSLYLERKGKDAWQATRSTFEDSFSKCTWESCPLYPNMDCRDEDRAISNIAIRLQTRGAKAQLAA